MSKKTIRVPWEAVTDGCSKQGHNFKTSMVEHLEAGDCLKIELPDGECRTFDDVHEFSEWFDAIKAAGNQAS